MEDGERAEVAPAQAFEWVSKELVWPDAGARQEMKDAWLAHANAGHRKLAKELRKAWASGVHWPRGEAYARTLGWLPPQERAEQPRYRGDDPSDLLAQRLSHVAHRIYRDPQVRQSIDPDSPLHTGRYTHVEINRNHFHDSERNACGIRKESLMSIEAGLVFMREPAHKHPACDCTVDPFPITSAERARLNAARGGQ